MLNNIKQDAQQRMTKSEAVALVPEVRLIDAVSALSHVDRLDARIVELGVVAVVGVAQDIHLNLKMAGVHRVGTLRFVGPIGAHLPHQLARRGIEQTVVAFFRRR